MQRSGEGQSLSSLSREYKPESQFKIKDRAERKDAAKRRERNEPETPILGVFLPSLEKRRGSLKKHRRQCSQLPE